MESLDLTEKDLAAQDAVLISTNHSDYDYAWLVRHARLAVDARNACAGAAAGRENIVKA
jgi:UDP-N-acetyl-D-glucosamine dehydrogenase